MSEYDFCEDCRAYGDDYVVDGDGILHCVCSTCPFNDSEKEVEDDG